MGYISMLHVPSIDGASIAECEFSRATHSLLRKAPVLKTSRRILATMLASAALLVSRTVEAQITYNVNLGAGSGSVVGTITTDGTLGNVTTGNLLSWSFQLMPNPGTSFLLTSGNGATAASSPLFASATQLVFDFSTNGYLAFQNPTIGSSVNYFCLTGGTQLCGGHAGGISVGTDVFGASFTAQTGQQVVATASTTVPEPSTVVLMASGLAIAGVMGRRRRKS